MPTGTVKWFNNAKGYGFILSDQGGEDLFAHYSAIEMDGYKTLKAGQQVSFEIDKGDKGLQAKHIRAPQSTQQDSANSAIAGNSASSTADTTDPETHTADNKDELESIS